MTYVNYNNLSFCCMTPDFDTLSFICKSKYEPLWYTCVPQVALWMLRSMVRWIMVPLMVIDRLCETWKVRQRSPLVMWMMKMWMGFLQLSMTSRCGDVSLRTTRRKKWKWIPLYLLLVIGWRPVGRKVMLKHLTLLWQKHVIQPSNSKKFLMKRNACRRCRRKTGCGVVKDWQCLWRDGVSAIRKGEIHGCCWPREVPSLQGEQEKHSCLESEQVPDCWKGISMWDPSPFDDRTCLFNLGGNQPTWTRSWGGPRPLWGIGCYHAGIWTSWKCFLTKISTGSIGI